MNPIPEMSDPDIYAERSFIDSEFIKIESNEYIGQGYGARRVYKC